MRWRRLQQQIGDRTPMNREKVPAPVPKPKPSKCIKSTGPAGSGASSFHGHSSSSSRRASTEAGTARAGSLPDVGEKSTSSISSKCSSSQVAVLLPRLSSSMATNDDQQCGFYTSRSMAGATQHYHSSSNSPYEAKPQQQLGCGLGRNGGAGGLVASRSGNRDAGASGPGYTEFGGCSQYSNPKQAYQTPLQQQSLRLGVVSLPACAGAGAGAGDGIAGRGQAGDAALQKDCCLKALPAIKHGV